MYKDISLVLPCFQISGVFFVAALGFGGIVFLFALSSITLEAVHILLHFVTYISIALAC